MKTEAVVLLVVVVGCVAAMAGGGLVLAIWAYAAWLGPRPQDDDEPTHIDETAAQVESRIADIHRQARERMATTVLRSTSEQADFDDLLRAAGESPSR